MSEAAKKTAENAANEESEKQKLTEDEMHANMLRLAFDNDHKLLEQFLDILSKEIPPDTEVVLRGSAVTGVRWKDGAPFDASGPGTSDLDLTLVGSQVHEFYKLDGYFLPGVHSKPLSEKDPDIAPELVPLREKLIQLVNRPVNIQATRDFVMNMRENWFDQPYLTLIKRQVEP